MKIISYLKKYFPYKTDHDLYDVFYCTACQYVHVDIMSAKSYFNITDPYEEIDPALIAALFILIMTILLLRQMIENSNIQTQFKKDATYLYEQLSVRFCSCLEMARCDPEHPNAIFEVLINRLKEQS